MILFRFFSKKKKDVKKRGRRLIYALNKTANCTVGMINSLVFNNKYLPNKVFVFYKRLLLYLYMYNIFGSPRLIYPRTAIMRTPCIIVKINNRSRGRKRILRFLFRVGRQKQYFIPKHNIGFRDGDWFYLICLAVRMT